MVRCSDEGPPDTAPPAKKSIPGRTVTPIAFSLRGKKNSAGPVSVIGVKTTEIPGGKKPMLKFPCKGSGIGWLGTISTKNPPPVMIPSDKIGGVTARLFVKSLNVPWKEIVRCSPAPPPLGGTRMRRGAAWLMITTTGRSEQLDLVGRQQRPILFPVINPFVKSSLVGTCHISVGQRYDDSL